MDSKQSPVLCSPQRPDEIDCCCTWMLTMSPEMYSYAQPFCTEEWHKGHMCCEATEIPVFFPMWNVATSTYSTALKRHRLFCWGVRFFLSAAQFNLFDKNQIMATPMHPWNEFKVWANTCTKLPLVKLSLTVYRPNTWAWIVTKNSANWVSAN